MSPYSSEAEHQSRKLGVVSSILTGGSFLHIDLAHKDSCTPLSLKRSIHSMINETSSFTLSHCIIPIHALHLSRLLALIFKGIRPLEPDQIFGSFFCSDEGASYLQAFRPDRLSSSSFSSSISKLDDCPSFRRRCLLWNVGKFPQKHKMSQDMMMICGFKRAVSTQCSLIAVKRR